MKKVLASLSFAWRFSVIRTNLSNYGALAIDRRRYHRSERQQSHG